MRTVRALRFAGNKALIFKEGKIDTQTLRGVRELSAESAHELDALLSAAAERNGRGTDDSNNETGTKALAAMREDSQAVRALLDVFFDSVSVENRRAWEMLLASGIDHAAATHPDRWVLALHQNRLRFIVGMVLCLQFDPRWGATVLLERNRAPEGLEMLGSEYKYAPGCDDALIPFAQGSDSADVIREAFKGAIDICGAAHGGTGSFRAAHSPGVLRYLEETLGRKLPDPNYASGTSSNGTANPPAPSKNTFELHPFGEEWSQDIEIMEDATLSVTEKKAVILARRGQGLFRQKILGVEPRCRVTGTADPNRLVASHIKPWSESTNQERLSAFNGLMLAPHVDHLFDCGLISFTDNGDLLVSSKCSSEVLQAWSIPSELNVGPFLGAQRPFLAHHRNKYEFAG